MFKYLSVVFLSYLLCLVLVSTLKSKKFLKKQANIENGPEITPSASIQDAPDITPNSEVNILDAPEITPGKEVNILDAPEITPGKEVEILDAPDVTPGKEVIILDAPDTTPGKEVIILDAPDTTPGKEVIILDAPDITIADELPGEHDYIINGKFEDGESPWESDDIEILDGSTYNPNWKTGKVSELDAWKGNTEISQEFNLPSNDKFELTFDATARNDVPLESNGLTVYWNGTKILDYVPKDYNIKHFVYLIQGKKGKNEIILKGEGKSEGVGITVDNISVKDLLIPEDECS